MALAVLGLAEAEAVGAAVGVARLQVELALLTGVAGVALHVGLAEARRRCLGGSSIDFKIALK